jgi:hypothetical protein
MRGDRRKARGGISTRKAMLFEAVLGGLQRDAFTALELLHPLVDGGNCLRRSRRARNCR